MDDTESRFDGQAIARRNLEKKPRLAAKNGCPGVFGTVRWLSWISRTRPDLSERSRLVTLLLVELSARNDQAFPSLRWLATHIGCSPSSVRLAIREAEQSGLVRRAERFDHREFSGGRQTSNRYEIILHPGLELQEGLGLEDRELVIVDDESDPNQLELAAPPEAHEGTPRPDRPTLASTRPRARVAAPNVVERGPIADHEGSPSQLEQGVKDLRESSVEKAASTRPIELPAPADASCESAAAFLGEVLSEERVREFKARFGHAAFASLLFAVKRFACRENPAVVKRALERLQIAEKVNNPGGYFMRVFEDELAATKLVEPPTTEDLFAEKERERRAVLQRRARELSARLEHVQCTDYSEADRIRAELEAVFRSLRSLSAPRTAESKRSEHKPAAGVHERASALSAADEALAMVRGRAGRPISPGSRAA